MKSRKRPSLGSKYVEVNAKENGVDLRGALSEIRCNKELCDVDFILENDEVIQAHRLVLACHSAYFRVMFVNTKFLESKQIRIVLKQVSSGVFNCILDFLYTGYAKVPTTQLFDVLKIANMYEFSQFVVVCSNLLLENISTYNCLDMLIGAEAVGVLELRNKCFQYVLQNFSIAVVNCKRAFLSLDISILKEMLPQDSLSSSEEFILETVLEWLQTSNSLYDEAEELLRMVRFTQMEPSYVHEKIMKDGKLLKKYPVLLELGKEAESTFALIQAGYDTKSFPNLKASNPRLQQFHSLVCSRFMSGHKKAVTCLMKLDNKILSGSCDKSIKIWNTKSWESERTIRCHEQVLSLLSFGDEVLSGSSDGVIIVWNPVNWQQRRKFVAHSDAISCLQSCNGKVISGGLDRCVKVWSPINWMCERTLQHARAVTCFLQCDRKLLSGSYDKTIKIWNTITWTCENTLQEHFSYVTCLVNCRNKVLSGSRDNTIKVWDSKSWTCIRTLRGHNSYVVCLLNCGDKLLSCSIDNTFKVWNPFTWECERTITQERGDCCFPYFAKLRERRIRTPACLLQFGNKILSGNSDRSITLWNITTHNSTFSKVEALHETPENGS